MSLCFAWRACYRGHLGGWWVNGLWPCMRQLIGSRRFTQLLAGSAEDGTLVMPTHEFRSHISEDEETSSSTSCLSGLKRLENQDVYSRPESGVTTSAQVVPIKTLSMMKLSPLLWKALRPMKNERELVPLLKLLWPSLVPGSVKDEGLTKRVTRS